MIFTTTKTDNVRFLFKNSEVLTELFENFFDLTPNKYEFSDNFKLDIIKIFSDSKFDLIQNDIVFQGENSDLLNKTYFLLEEISKEYKSIIDTIDQIYKQKIEKKVFDFSQIDDKEE
jgi:hypothetical protein